MTFILHKSHIYQEKVVPVMIFISHFALFYTVTEIAITIRGETKYCKKN